MKIPFQGYAHVSKEDCLGTIEKTLEEHKVEITEDAFTNSMYWGYEISLQCVLDTDTGDVEIVGCDGFPLDKTKKLKRKGE